MNNRRPLFITLEGGDGSGKTTMMGRLAAYMQGRSIPYLITREPGGIEIAEKIRSIILDPQHTSMDARTEALLYAAARRQHLVEKVEPALREGVTVLCDRFVDSSLVYQGYARGLGMEEVWSINRFAVEGRMPDLTLLFDIEPEIGMSRIEANAEREKNRLDMESMAFHGKVREGYMLVAENNKERIRIVDASKTPDQVEREMIKYVEDAILKDF
ncbi:MULTISPECIES: dTMP kinase [Paenibacillus]|uniref:Thymidylate kinase n=1 Tax=Paenibacillus lactis TaxID=228574 RepID=A0ABS4FJW8_9BACL|nr:dTMP kinase [Paenibacillus lactis]MBP1896523.1 dTMP kinase [Paenibacillus lactis]MCM3497556.1 dTMP kinase [Paenibacillus lactis]GIO94511.1 thymidylate kinase [Paenibacillus lactis]HAF99062.1 dTMP kinase [Paenibacillus lactis]